MAKDGIHLESDYCKHLAKPNGHRECRGGRCPKWKAGAWSQVSNASPYVFLTFGQLEASVLACAPGPGSGFSERSSGPGREDSVAGYLLAVGPWARASALGTLNNPCSRVVVRINSE